MSLRYHSLWKNSRDTSGKDNLYHHCTANSIYKWLLPVFVYCYLKIERRLRPAFTFIERRLRPEFTFFSTIYISYTFTFNCLADSWICYFLLFNYNYLFYWKVILSRTVVCLRVMSARVKKSFKYSVWLRTDFSIVLARRLN